MYNEFVLVFIAQPVFLFGLTRVLLFLQIELASF